MDDTPGSKAFVRGGTINPNDKLKIDSEGPLQQFMFLNFHYTPYIYESFSIKSG